MANKRNKKAVEPEAVAVVEAQPEPEPVAEITLLDIMAFTEQLGGDILSGEQLVESEYKRLTNKIEAAEGDFKAWKDATSKLEALVERAEILKNATEISQYSHYLLFSKAMTEAKHEALAAAIKERAENPKAAAFRNLAALNKSVEAASVPAPEPVVATVMSITDAEADSLNNRKFYAIKDTEFGALIPLWQKELMKQARSNAHAKAGGKPSSGQVRDAVKVLLANELEARGMVAQGKSFQRHVNETAVLVDVERRAAN